MEFSISGISEALAARRGQTEYSKKRRADMAWAAKDKLDQKKSLRTSLGRSTSKDEDAAELEKDYEK